MNIPFHKKLYGSAFTNLEKENKIIITEMKTKNLVSKNPNYQISVKYFITIIVVTDKTLITVTKRLWTIYV